MSRNINVNPGHYKVAGRERQGEAIHQAEQQAGLHDSAGGASWVTAFRRGKRPGTRLCRHNHPSRLLQRRCGKPRRSKRHVPGEAAGRTKDQQEGDARKEARTRAARDRSPPGCVTVRIARAQGEAQHAKTLGLRQRAALAR